MNSYFYSDTSTIVPSSLEQTIYGSYATTLSPNVQLSTIATKAAASSSASIIISNATNAVNLLNLTANIFNTEYDSNKSTLLDEDYEDCDPRNPLFNCTVEQYLVFARGPKTQQLWMALSVSIIT